MCSRRSQNYKEAIEAMAFGSNVSEEEAVMYYLNVGSSYNSITIFLNLYSID